MSLPPSAAVVATHAGPPIAVVDCAGAIMGGARRYLDELDSWLERRSFPVEVIGRGRRLDPPWLAQREVSARRTGALHAVALNNVSLVSTSGRRTVLVANVLHFLDSEEIGDWPGARIVALQGKIVQLAMRRADRIVVPSTSMANLVAARCPWATERLEVLAHPLSVPPAPKERDPRRIICPVFAAPYKHLGKKLEEAVVALDALTTEGPERPTLLVTMSEDEADRIGFRRPAWVQMLGRITTVEAARQIDQASVVFYPCTLEAYGYPLAEARIRRIPVVAPDSPLTREVAGDALVGYRLGSVDSLREAFEDALSRVLSPLETNPYDPDRYFAQMFRLETR